MALSKCLAFPRLSTAIVARRMIHITKVSAGGHDHVEHWWYPEFAAGRTQVGHGVNGDPVSLENSHVI